MTTIWSAAREGCSGGLVSRFSVSRFSVSLSQTGAWLALAVLGAACSGPPAQPSTVAAATPPSCTDLPKTCGALSAGDCCESLPVPGGSFLRNNDAALQATVSAFHLDKYEVSVGRFRKFVSEFNTWRAAGNPSVGFGQHPLIPKSGWMADWTQFLPESTERFGLALRCDRQSQTWTTEPGANETRPINCVNWYEAFAFCAWDGGRLPTLAEWNFAATAGNEQREYPWSVPATDTTITPDYASYYSMGDCWGDGQPGCGLSDFLNVGSKPLGDGKYGQADLAGNVREWALDWARAFPMPCNDCSNLESGELRVLRGGAWNNVADLVKSSAILEDYPANHYFVIGLRCARNQ